MIRGVNREPRAAATSNALETISAAANAIASSENRLRDRVATRQTRRWGRWLSVYWCFGFHRHKKRIGHAVIIPESPPPRNDASPTENPTQAPAIALPFAAPPSSPASFLQSEPPSAMQSPPPVLTSLTLSANMYSPSGPASMFAVGPYAHETQLVSPPVFSTFTTEPSTAPFTPPPESVHLTTPSSPEVPFARLLDPQLQNGQNEQGFPLSSYEFQSYQFHPGSPVCQLISPSSGISGSETSSPFPDDNGSNLFPFRMSGPPKLLNLDKLSAFEWGSWQGSGTLTPEGVSPTSNKFLLDLEHQLPDLASRPHSEHGCLSDHIATPRMSFDLPNEETKSTAEQNPEFALAALAKTTEDGTSPPREGMPTVPVVNSECHNVETSTDTPEKPPSCGEERSRHHKRQSITLGSIKEFNFDAADEGNPHIPNTGPDLCLNGSIDVKDEEETTKDWSFPMIMPEVS